MRSKKINILLCVYEELINEFREIDDLRLRSTVEGWVISLKQTQEILGDPSAKVKSSQLVSGFEQGLHETPILLVGLPQHVRAGCIKAFYSIIEQHLPGFFDKKRRNIERIVSKGAIRTENEWFIVRIRMDEIEGLSEFRAEFEKLDNMLVKYEQNV